MRRRETPRQRQMRHREMALNVIVGAGISLFAFGITMAFLFFGETKKDFYENCSERWQPMVEIAPGYSIPMEEYDEFVADRARYEE